MGIAALPAGSRMITHLTENVTQSTHVFALPLHDPMRHDRGENF